ncbi:hypothetical protein [Micromonospora sp. NBC_00421]|uniref:hypothetical protein n=1 Tax=Micromonospora sp. NBC_00421 TaxID=2975976 RepID=UPI002E1C8EC7
MTGQPSADAQTGDDRTTAMLAAPWTAVPNNEIGGWTVSHNGMGPLNGGPMPADMVWSWEVAERIAADHNNIAGMRAALTAEADALEQSGGMVSAHWVAEHLRFIAQHACRWPQPWRRDAGFEDATGPLSATTAAERGAAVSASTPNPAEATTTEQHATEENR